MSVVNVGGERGAAKAERAQRRELVSVMLLSRLTYRQIIEQLARQGIEVSLGTVSNDAAAIRGAWMRRAAENYDAHVAEQVADLDQMLSAWLPKALSAQDDKAATVVLRTLERKARLLGLDRPVKADVSGHVTVEVSTEELVAEGRALIDELAEKRARKAG